jgi:hypothetical protein
MGSPAWTTNTERIDSETDAGDRVLSGGDTVGELAVFGLKSEGLNSGAH